MKPVLLAALALLPLANVAWADVDPAVLEAEAQRIAAVKKATPTVVAIFAMGGQGGGSGVLISADGYALTNFHVSKPAGTGMKCGLADGKLYDAVIVGLDPTGDVALVKLLGREDFPAAELANSDAVQPGDWCFAMGNPFLLATDFKPTLTYGMVSGVHRYQYPSGTLLEYADCLQVDAAINPGNSGGPLFNAEGQLIGINGRGSFEKRGRVNVGVGYAISINQIKNFLGYLKSGRIVDHATLGARVATSEDGRVVVTDILDESDAYRRGLRYDDEIVSFAGRPIRTANAMKNMLGTLPKDWRVPLSYRRKGQRFDVLVRLAGVHRSAELVALTTALDEDEPAPQTPEPDPKPAPETPKPKEGQPNDPEKHKSPREKGKPKLAKGHPAPALPEIVKQHFLAKTGYANYFFNKLNQDRVARLLRARGDFSALSGGWVIDGTAQDHSAVHVQLDDQEAMIDLPVGQTKIAVTERLDAVLNPPGSGGLLAALHLWRKMLIQGPGKFDQVVYLGTAPMPGQSALVDVLIATHNGVDCRFLVSPDDGTLLGLEMFPDENADPAEVYFSDYREEGGRFFPYRWEVRHADQTFGVFNLTKLQLAKPEVK